MFKSLIICLLFSTSLYAKTFVELDTLQPLLKLVDSIKHDSLQIRLGYQFTDFRLSYLFTNNTGIEGTGSFGSNSGIELENESGKYQTHVARFSYNIYQGIYLGAGIGSYKYNADLKVRNGSTVEKEDVSSSLFAGEVFANYSFDFLDGIYLKGEINYSLGAGSTSLDNAGYSYDTGKIGQGVNLYVLLGYRF